MGENRTRSSVQTQHPRSPPHGPNEWTHTGSMLQVLIELTVVSMTRIEPMSNREGGGGGKEKQRNDKVQLEDN